MEVAVVVGQVLGRLVRHVAARQLPGELAAPAKRLRIENKTTPGIVC